MAMATRHLQQSARTQVPAHYHLSFKVAELGLQVVPDRSKADRRHTQVATLESCHIQISAIVTVSVPGPANGLSQRQDFG